MIDSIQMRHIAQIHTAFTADKTNYAKQKVFWVAWQAHQAPRCALVDLVIADLERKMHAASQQ